VSIAFSEGSIFYDEIRGDSRANFMTDFLAAAAVCGWSSAAITDGYLFTIASKQGLTAKIKLWDRALPGQDELHIQFMSFDTTLTGYRHSIPMTTGRTYLLHMNECQFFLGVPEVEALYAVQGGIPFVPDYAADIGDCTDEVFLEASPTITSQAFWSNGWTGTSGPNFRWSHQAGYWSALHNSDLMNSELVPNYEARNVLRIVPVAVSIGVPTSFWSSILQRTKHFTLDETELIGFAFDPILAWGSNSSLSAQARFRGQIYDAFQPSLDVADLDHHLNGLFGADWVHYMHKTPGTDPTGTRFGSLYLALGNPTATVAEAYIY
jgi:hypothetical protein